MVFYSYVLQDIRSERALVAKHSAGIDHNHRIHRTKLQQNGEVHFTMLQFDMLPVRFGGKRGAIGSLQVSSVAYEQMLGLMV